MDPYVRRLIQRLNDPARPLSRNRHFHVFDSPEGRYALKLFRRLQALQKDILACRAEGRMTRFARCSPDGAPELRIELRFDRLRGRRVSLLLPDEFELLLELPGVRECLEEARVEAA